MEKVPAPTKKGTRKFSSFLPKTASVTFQNPPFSPGREIHKLKSNINKGFSGPIISIIPAEARRSKSKNGSFDTSQEPTSPKISCMGQIKHKKKVCKSKCPNLPTQKEVSDQKKNPKLPKLKKVLKPSFSDVGVAEKDRKLHGWNSKKNQINISEPHDNIAPRLDQMKRFTSGRDVLASFDWTSNTHDHRLKDEEDEDHEVIIAHSAPLTMGGRERGGGIALEPRTDVNLWKRRTMAPPKPLQINVTTKPK